MDSDLANVSPATVYGSLANIFGSDLEPMPTEVHDDLDRVWASYPHLAPQQLPTGS